LAYNNPMLSISGLRGVIFDVDDTLLSNHPAGSQMGLHEESRLAAAHAVGKRHNIAALKNMTGVQASEAFFQAKEHTLQATVWQMLYMAGLVVADEPEPGHPLLNELMELKDVLHEDILRQKGREVPGARAFVEKLATHGLDGKLAIASSAYRRDIDLALEITGLEKFFPDNKIISRERFTHAKPHPEAFNLAFAALGMPESDRQRIVVFEDDPRGIMSAKAANIFTCAITTRFNRKDLKNLEIAPDLIADSYAEFENLLGL
jgi:HAD superfamily hydrolase (TIGR01509 family)